VNALVKPHGLPSFGEAATARCPGATVQDIVARDSSPPPEVLRTEQPEFLGSEDIGFARYYDPVQFDAELEKVWGRCWQWVCREEHIPEPGDYYTYEIADRSYLVVRQQDGGIKGFVNSCLHRGTKFKRGEGVGSAPEIRCPYHGWSWSNAGKLKAVPCAWDFAHVDPAAFSLPEVRTSRWGGFVFINPSDEGPGLDEYLAPLPDHFRDWDLDRRYIELHIAKELPCNWKAAMEAFLESYHVVETHPQLLRGTGDANVQYDIHSDHVTRFYAVGGVNSPHLAEPLSEQQLVDAMLIGDRTVMNDELVVGEGETARTVMARFLRKALGDRYQSDLGRFSDSEIIDTIEYHVFPNMVLFPGISLPMVYRFRPIGRNPERTLFELLFLRPLPEHGLAPEPPEPISVSENESYASVPGVDPVLGYVYDQDTDNLRAQQLGFRASRKGKQTLGNYQEVRIRHFEQVLDRYLAS
jgi:nitrite reductase/ring-hydroxylating ferredoxin subunit